MADEVSLKKRAQISKANRTMFIWIAAASALVGAAAVVSYFMFKILLYEEKVLAVKADTASTLSHNLKVVDDLRTEIKKLDANEALMSIKANETDRALQVILDALPSDANSLALGASLQNKLLVGGNANVTVESIQVDPVQGVETTDDSGVVDSSPAATTDGSENAIRFQFTVRGTTEGLRGVMNNLERSIRTIKVTTLRISGEPGGQTMAVEGYAFYQPAKVIELRDQAVPREGKR